MKTMLIPYQDNDTELEGYLAYDGNQTGARPAVLIGHAWAGREEFYSKKAQALAKLGYVGFVIDMYGKGVVGHNNEENAKLIQPFLEDRALVQRRMKKALEVVSAEAMVDSSRIAVMGYCFGGLCALDLARSGADIRGAVSFHGNLSSPQIPANKPIKAKVLALHGHDDPMVPQEQVRQFENEMTAAKVDWQLHIYGNTMHAFTKPEANDPGFGTVYNEAADKRSWMAMQNFLKEVF